MKIGRGLSICMLEMPDIDGQVTAFVKSMFKSEAKVGNRTWNAVK